MTTPDVAYVMTHHPRTALTFIDLEIREIEQAGGVVAPVAVNVPDHDDLRTDEARRRRDSTLYLKQRRPDELARGLVATLVRHPVKMGALLLTAITSARLDLSLAARRLAHLAYACEVWKVAGQQGITHFHAHFGQTPATIAWFTAEVGNLSRPRRCTWSFTIHGFQDFADERVTRLDLKAEHAAFVVCVSDFTRAQLCRVTDPTRWDRFHIVRCGIDLERFDYDPPRRPAGRFRIITVARLSPEKGHLILLEAAAQLRSTGVDLDIEIVGGGPTAALIRSTAERLELADRIHLAGELLPDEVSERLRAADVFCLPSFAEGIPVSIMEAMAIGIPVVTTYVGGIPELAVDGDTALVVPPGNSEALAAALRRLVEDFRLGQCLANNARSAVAQRHDVTRNVESLRSLFDQYTRSPDPAPR